MLRKAFCARLSAAIARETLKLGSSTTDKLLLKELIRVLCLISPEDWIDGNKVRDQLNE